jgi:hypothetical protein
MRNGGNNVRCGGEKRTLFLQKRILTRGMQLGVLESLAALWPADEEWKTTVTKWLAERDRGNSRDEIPSMRR